MNNFLPPYPPVVIPTGCPDDDEDEDDGDDEDGFIDF